MDESFDEADKELSDAQKELIDAQQELDDGQKELDEQTKQACLLYTSCHIELPVSRTSCIFNTS